MRHDQGRDLALIDHKKIVHPHTFLTRRRDKSGMSFLPREISKFRGTLKLFADIHGALGTSKCRFDDSSNVATTSEWNKQTRKLLKRLL